MQSSVNRFEDADFPPTKNSIGSPVLNEYVHGWRRPHEIWPDVDLKIFADCNVLQGDLNDCWFLGALSSANARGLLSGLVVESDIQGGKYTIRFFKSGKWIHVTIDDMLPCDETGHPLFASASESGILWPSIFEKAYAKLHTNYSALNGGSEADALCDLTGGIPTVLDMSHPDNSDVDRLWNRFVSILSEDNAPIMGASHFDSNSAANNSRAPGEQTINAKVTLDPNLPPAPLSFTMTESAHDVAQAFCSRHNLPQDFLPAIVQFVEGHQSGAKEHEKQRKANPGAIRAAAREKAAASPQLLTNHTYTILLMWEEDDERFVRLGNPWGVGGMPSQAIDGEDGEFTLTWNDFNTLLNAITICSLSPRGEVLEINGKWETANNTAGGLSNVQENPQFVLYLVSNSSVTIILEQEEFRIKGERNNFPPIGFDIDIPDSDDGADIFSDENKLVTSISCRRTTKMNGKGSVFAAFRQVVLEDVSLQAGKHVILPSTYHPGKERSFILRVCITPST